MFDILLDSLQTESKLARRKVHVLSFYSYLYNYIESTGLCLLLEQVYRTSWYFYCQTHEGITHICWFAILLLLSVQLLVAVLVSCIEDSSYPETRSTQAHSLHALATLITHTWPRYMHMCIRVNSILCCNFEGAKF